MKIFENSLKWLLRFSGNLLECSEISGIFEKLRKRFKSVFQMYFFFIFGKSSEIPGVFKNHRKISGREIGTVHNGSQTLKSFGAAF